MPPFFSIIIPTFNSAATIAAALESVAIQDCDDFEVIVSDGASSDGTLEAVSRYRDALPNLTVLSGPDEGVYDAINQAIDVARGSWVHILGSDDRLHARDVLSRFRVELASGHEPLVYGDVIFRGTSPLAGDGERYGGAFDMKQLLAKNICQQAIFYQRELFDWVGKFEPRYKICGDWHFALRTFARYPTRWVDAIVCDFVVGGLSRQVDEAFIADYPDLLLRLLIMAPMRRHFIPIRWIFYHHALACRQQRRLLRSVVFYAASIWLAVHEKLTSRSRFNA